MTISVRELRTAVREWACCTCTCTSIRTSFRTSVCHTSVDLNFCALSLIILFYICPCCDTRFKNVCLFLFVEVKALLGLCHMLYNIRHKIKFLCLWNLVTLLHPYVRLFVHQYVTPLSNSFDQNFMELGHIV